METTEKKFRLPKEFAEKWIAALRSGEYKQGKHRLCKIYQGNKTYCCLGVAGSICGYNDEILAQQNLPYKETVPLMPTEIQAGSVLVSDLVRMNDGDGMTFPEIADWIEQNVELY